MSALAKCWFPALIAGTVAIAFSGALHARDPGIKQPGAAGNVHRDPDLNQNDERNS